MNLLHRVSKAASSPLLGRGLDEKQAFQAHCFFSGSRHILLFPEKQWQDSPSAQPARALSRRPASFFSGVFSVRLFQAVHRFSSASSAFPLGGSIWKRFFVYPGYEIINPVIFPFKPAVRKAFFVLEHEGKNMSFLDLSGILEASAEDGPVSQIFCNRGVNKYTLP